MHNATTYVILLERTKTSRPKIKSKGLALEIRCKANILPLKAILYAIAHARQKACKPKNSNSTLYVPRLTAQMREIASSIDALNAHSNQPMRLAQSEPQADPDDPEANSSSIESSIRTYVDFFYTISKAERKEYIETFGNPRARVGAERNLLLIPALMAEMNQPKEEVSRGLFWHLYRMPFKALYDSSKSALHVGNLLNNMAIRSVQYDTIDSFSKSMSRLEARIKTIEKGTIRPMEDERLKAEFIERAIGFSKITDINVIDIMSHKVGTESAIRARMQRMIRKATY